MECRSQDGYLIIEVMVAVVIIATALIGLCASQIQSHRLNADAAFLTEIRSAADHVAEQLRLHQADTLEIPGSFTVGQETPASTDQSLLDTLSQTIQRPLLHHSGSTLEGSCTLNPIRGCQYCFTWQAAHAPGEQRRYCSSRILL